MKHKSQLHRKCGTRLPHWRDLRKVKHFFPLQLPFVVIPFVAFVPKRKNAQCADCLGSHSLRYSHTSSTMHCCSSLTRPRCKNEWPKRLHIRREIISLRQLVPILSKMAQRSLQECIENPLKIKHMLCISLSLSSSVWLSIALQCLSRLGRTAGALCECEASARDFALSSEWNSCAALRSRASMCSAQHLGGEPTTDR